jgi:hypothetical protein
VRLDHFRAIVVERGIDERAHRQLERIEQLQAAPNADAVAIVPPRMVEHVGLGTLRAERGAQAGAEVEVLYVEADVDREALLAGPVVVRAPGNCRIRVPPVRFEGAHLL